MRVSLAWLAEWVPLPASPEALAERLTLAGLEIEETLREGPDLGAFVVGEVRERAVHPEVERLSVCRVDLGDGALHTIVCGAPNVAAGQKVAVVRPGGSLPDGTRIKKAMLRGVESAGMICSARELGLGEDQQGILVLDPAARPGTPLSEVLRAGDTVLDLEITPNRGDWASMLGIAREVRAHFGGRLTLPPCDVSERGAPAKQAIAVAIDDPGGCHHYAARVVRGVRPGPSPEWLVRRLEAAGIRSHDVVVDVTNLVLLEFGQPLHAFDLARLRGAVVRVRGARAGEKIATLDGALRELAEGELVIADAERPVAIAGVMGGAETEVGERTRDVLIESAHFDPARVRASARRLGLRSEASYRFERGVDPAGVQRAADRAARLLAELAGGEVAAGVVEAHGHPAPRPAPITLDPELPARVLGARLSPTQVGELLGRVDVQVERREGGALVCRAPSWRADLRIPEDLVEEVARVHGYDRIEPVLPRQPLAPVSLPPRFRLAQRARDALAGAGLFEIDGFPGAYRTDADQLQLPPDAPERRAVELLNPFSEADALLRTSLVPGLLRAAQRNLSHQVEAVRLFEVGPVFLARPPSQQAAAGEPGLPEERLLAGAVLAGEDRTGFWERDRAVPLYYRMRAAAERLAAGLGLELGFTPGSRSAALHPGASADLRCGEQWLGTLGELHPQVAERFEIGEPCAVLELDLTPLLGRPDAARGQALRPVSRHPLVRRDVAVLLDRGVCAAEVEGAIRKAGGELLTDVRVFDRYEGEGIAPGKVSLAFRMVFQHAERTLREEEVQRATERVRRTLVHRFQGELR